MLTLVQHALSLVNWKSQLEKRKSSQADIKPTHQTFQVKAFQWISRVAKFSSKTVSKKPEKLTLCLKKVNKQNSMCIEHKLKTESLNSTIGN